jgi:Mg2+ and Co2+ transporter CorA
MQEEFDLHKLAIGDTLSAHQRPKLEVYGDSLFVVLYSINLTGEKKLDFCESHFLLVRILLFLYSVVFPLVIKKSENVVKRCLKNYKKAQALCYMP